MSGNEQQGAHCLCDIGYMCAEHRERAKMAKPTTSQRTKTIVFALVVLTFWVVCGFGIYMVVTNHPKEDAYSALGIFTSMAGGWFGVAATSLFVRWLVGSSIEDVDVPISDAEHAAQTRERARRHFWNEAHPMENYDDDRFDWFDWLR